MRWLIGIPDRLRLWWRCRTFARRPLRRSTARADVAAHADRLRALAKAEEISFDEFYDAVRQLAVEHPRTMDQVLDVVEEYGLAGAEERMMEADR